jgi:hypothetical protein
MTDAVKDRPNPLLLGAALLYFAGALALLFAPDEILAAMSVTAGRLDALLVQLVAAALFGFAMLDWMQRFTRTGGIYGRPLVIANFAHSATAALSLVHGWRAGGLPTLLLGALVAYGVLAIAFGWAFFGPGPRT